MPKVLMTVDLRLYMKEKLGVSPEELQDLSDDAFDALNEKAMDLEVEEVYAADMGEKKTKGLTLATQLVDYFYDLCNK